MTETASPDPAHANSTAINGSNEHDGVQPSPERAKILDLDDSELSDVNLSDIDDFEPSDLHEHPPTPGSDVKTDRHPREPDDTPDEPSAKRRRLRESTPTPNGTRKSKPISPPWKKFEADGPTSFTENGRRKSGRTNYIPLEHQSGDKRITRKSFGQKPSPPKAQYASARSTRQHSPTPTKRPSSSGKVAPSRTTTTKAPSRKSQAPEPKARSRRRSSSPNPPPARSKPSTAGTRRSTRHARESNDEDGGSPTTVRIKLRVRPPLTTIPLVHRDQANVRPKLGPTFEEWFARAGDIPAEEGGLYASEDGPRFTDEMARQDAAIIDRIEEEAQPGGLLAESRCSVFEPEAEEEPPRQWAHVDHLVKAVGNFRRLMLQEQQRHRAAAKRIAIACEAEWRRRNPQPKTAEELELEEKEKTKIRWRQVNKAVTGTWENVRIEVNRQRLLQWEAEEQRRVKAALNQAVNMSEQKLQARQARLDTDDLSDDLENEDEMGSDEELDEDEDDSGLEMESERGGRPSEDESNMSSSDDDDDKSSMLSDEGLTQEQLREKYAGLPELGSTDADDATPALDTDNAGTDTPMVNGETGDDDTSDESIDMDDDLGSTEDEMDSEEDGTDGDDEESEDDEPAGLLGLFFKKSELKKIKEEAAAQEPDQTAGEASVEATLDTEPSNAEATANGTKHDATSSTEEAVSTKLEPASTNGNPNGHRPDSSEQEQIGPITNGVVKTARFTEPVAGEQTSKNTAKADDDNTAPVETVESQDVDMQDANVEAQTDMKVTNPGIPDVEITDAPIESEHLSAETEGVASLQSPSRSLSPRTSDTKPTDIDTASSVERALSAPKADSRLTSPAPNARTDIPFLLRGKLREYQHHGLDWLASLYSNNTNGILADEMGLGKTIQTIALLAHLACYHEVWGPHLVIVPTSVMLNWEMEFKKWCPGFKILTYYGNQEERKRKRHGWTNDDVWNVCITSYQMVLQDQQVFRRRRWHYMILDEAHNIKNFKSKRWQTLLGFNTHSRLLLTGTPLQNNLTELWSLLYFLTPPENGEGGFVDQQEFNNWFSRPENQILENGREDLDDEARAIISKLHKVLRPYLLRRLKADVEKQMPAKYEHVEFCRLSKRQRELYDGFLSRSDTRQTLSSGNYMSIINCLMQLRKVCNHPDLFVDRPIMTSFRMRRSVPAEFAATEQVVQSKLLFVKPMNIVSLSFLNMVPTQYEHLSSSTTDRIAQLSSNRVLLDLREYQKTRANATQSALDPETVKSNIVYLESAARWGRFEELQHCVYLNALRRQQRPIYGKGLVDMLTLDTTRRPFKQRPKVPRQIMSWFEEDSFLLHNAIPTLQQRAGSMDTLVSKFAFVTPAIVAPDMSNVLLGSKGVDAFEEENLRLAAPVRYAPYMPKEPPLDPWHEARVRLSIQFPDKRLLQYDCGKLQALDKLLRKLQAGGHRALIFTQMTKVLDVLEQFLNIHGHKYLRLDGATKVEQRQILTDRFNHDPRILCFILSTRSGGLGINLTGADTVIFYDQDWNPAMDKQCQDRCHRIGQTRDVHIYRLVSEHTIEANILRKASQKQMLDDVVIQEGEFTTDYFNKLSVRDVIGNNGEVFANVDDLAANAAVDRVLGGVESDQRKVVRDMEKAEDQEDVAAARVAEKEIQQDDEDFLEQRPTPGGGSGVSSARQGTPRDGTEPPTEEAGAGGEAVELEHNAFGERMHTIDDYMLQSMAAALEGTPLDLP
ncbi:hypothetical protein GQ53DRAFT_609412, partial [Thozetella sp. PMI_491]